MIGNSIREFRLSKSSWGYLVFVACLINLTNCEAQHSQQDKPLSNLKRAILQRPQMNERYLNDTVLSALSSYAKQGGAQAVEKELRDAGAHCVEEAPRRKCRIELSQTRRGLGLFPKSNRRTFRVDLVYEQRGSSVTNIQVNSKIDDELLDYCWINCGE